MESKNLVFDACALIEFFSNGPKARKVLGLIQQVAANLGKLYLNPINWGEVLYVTEMRHGEAQKNILKKKIKEMGIILTEINQDLIEKAAKLKAKDKIPYADAFAAATALQKKASLVTGDADFKVLAKKIKILWL